MIFVTKTFLPPQNEYQKILSKAWDAGWITNRGVLVNELEDKLKSYLGIHYILAMTNGTLPLQIAIKTLDLHGEIITTPFSYVATTSSIVWEGCTPVFVDINPEYFTIDETKIEAAITEKTTAILATHVFGNPCAIEAIDLIAKKFNLKVIYDAAHCFGVTYKGQSVFNYGDISTCSFHATKIFHTGEGGALFCNDVELHKKAFYHHNFGHKGKENFQGLGINGKMSELQAAMGLAVLPYMKEILERRAIISNIYKETIENVEYQMIRKGTHINYSYFPVLLESKILLSKIIKSLNQADIYPRRYFYPSLDTLPYISDKVQPISRDISSRILCLPIYEDLSMKTIELIANAFKNNI